MRTWTSVVVAVFAIACGATSTPAAPGKQVQMVTAVVRMNGCPGLSPANAKLAETTMQQLTEGCSSVPGGHVAILATLQPNGRIELSVAEGQPETVPLCVLKHALTHKVTLQKACQLEVTLEQGAVQVAGARDASVD